MKYQRYLCSPVLTICYKIKSAQMLNFASLFNQWRSQNNNGIADLLSQNNVDIGRLLDEESFQGEYKSGSQKVVEFMKYERYQELIQFVTVVGPADDKKRSYKYPLSACQVLTIENNTALDFFLPDKPIILENKIEEQVEVQIQVQVEDSSSEKKQQDSNEPVSEGKQKKQGQEEDKKEEKPEEKEQKQQKQQAKEEPNADKQPEVEILQEAPAEKENKQEKPEGEESPNEPEQIKEVETPKKIKKVMKKELKTIEKIEQRQVPALIHKLLAYFDGEINYTLAGYVSKILAVLLAKKPAELMKYLLEEQMMHKIINHAESRSIGELIVKILTHESTLMLEQRREFFKELLKRNSVPSEIEVISNISSYICETIEKIAANLKGNSKINQFNTTFFSLDIITKVIKNVMSDEENVAVYNAPVLLTYLTNVPFVLPEDENVVNEFVKLGQMFIENSCQKLQTDKRKRPKIGFGRVKIIEILRFVLKENILNSKQIVAKTQNFFPILLNLVKQYDMNNMLHNEVMRIIEIALNEAEDSPLNQSILKDNILFNFINEEWQEDKKIKAGDSVYKYRKGYIAHVINLCVKLRQLSGNNLNIKKMIESPEFSTIFQNFIEKQVFNSKKSLAGLMKRQQKHEILFQKQDIISAHMTFLQKCPNPVYEPDPTQTEASSESPDLVEELQRQLEENMNIKSSKEEQESPKSSPEKMQVEDGEDNDSESAENEGRYWATHIEYKEIDDLMADL